MVDRGVQKIAGITLVLDVTEFRNVLHRAGPIEGHQRDNILDTVRLHLAQGIHHARTLHLKHGDRIGGGIKFIGLLVVQRDRPDVDVNVAQFQQVQRVLNDGQGFQTQEVELHQPRRFHPFHVELCGRHI